MLRTIAIFVVVGLISVHSTSAQQAPVQHGEKIRVTARSLGYSSLVGMFLSVDGDTLRFLVEPDATALAVPLDELDQIDVTRGQRSRWGDGAVLGSLVLGLGLGALAASQYEEPEPCEGWCIRMFDYDEGDVFLMGFVGGAVLGGVAGGLIGKQFKTDRWDDVQLDRASMRLSLLRDGRFALGVKLPL